MAKLATEALMTSLADRPNTALLIIDVQRDVVANAHDVKQVVANINTLVDKARSEQVPVIWVQHDDEGLPKDTAGWEYVPELSPRSDEPMVHKSYGDSFEETDLEALLAERKIGRLVVTGAQTDACIRSTLHGALVRGYDATLVEDAHTTEDLREYGSPLAPNEAIAFTNMYWRYSKAPGRKGDTAPTAEVTFGAS